MFININNESYICCFAANAIIVYIFIIDNDEVYVLCVFEGNFIGKLLLI